MSFTREGSNRRESDCDLRWPRPIRTSETSKSRYLGNNGTNDTFVLSDTAEILFLHGIQCGPAAEGKQPESNQIPPIQSAGCIYSDML
jgi:hypothetical protein